MEDMISLIPGYEYVKQKFNNLAPLKESKVTTTPAPLPKEWDGWVTFWLKHPNERLYPTVCDNPSSSSFGQYSDLISGWTITNIYICSDSTIITPAMAQLLANAASNFASSHSVQMKASVEDDSQIYQAGSKFYEVYDGETVRYRVCLENLRWSVSSF
jgi:hypothetical protein